MVGLFLFNVAAKHAEAVCMPSTTMDYICPTPSVPYSTVSSSAPAPGSIRTSPMYNPGSGHFAGNAQPFYDVGNDTQFNHPISKIPIYMRYGDIINITINNASPACLTKDNVTNLYYPDYSDNYYNSAPTTTYSVNTATNSTVKIIGPSWKCGTPYTFYGLSWRHAMPIKIHDYQNNKDDNVDSNGLSGSGYVYYIMLDASVNQNDLMKGENTFTVTITNTTGNTELASGTDQTGYSYREGDLSSTQTYTQEIVFGTDETCNHYSQTVSGQVSYADMDANNYGYQSTIEMILQQESWDQGNSDNWTGWTNVKTLDQNYLLQNENGSFPENSFNNSYRYRLLIINVGRKNTIFLSLAGSISQLSGQYHLGLNDCFSVSCSASASPTNPAVNQGATITVNLTNATDSNTLPGSFEVRQTAPVGTPQNVGGLVAGKSEKLTFNIQPRASPMTREFDYTLYSASGSSGQVVGKSPLCSTSITWGVRSVSISCQNVEVYGITGTNVTLGMAGGGPLVDLASAHNTSGQVAAFLPPPGGGGGGSTPASHIPIKLTLSGNGPDEIVYEWVPVNSKGNQTANQYFDTFNTFSGAWPHKDGYSVNLSYSKGGSYSSTLYPGNPQQAYVSAGNYEDGGTDFLGVCMKPVSCSANISSPDVEPGEDTSYVFSINVNNQSPDSFSASNGRGYDVKILTSGGAELNSGSDTQPLKIPAGVSSNMTIQPAPISFSGYLNYTGHYTVQMIPQDGSNQDLLANNSISCTGTSTPVTKPYFQVWNGDAASGGGFASPTYNPAIEIIGSCGGKSDPPYVSVASNGYSYSGSPYSGGIIAYGKQAEGFGSQVDFGAVAMGLIPGQSTGDFGFFSGSPEPADYPYSLHPIFANTTGSSTNMGGSLDGTPPNHCVKDYYDDTQASPQPSSGNLQADINNKNCSGSCQYIYNGNFPTITGANLPAGRQITLYVNGNVTIGGNIMYPSTFNPSDQSNIPYLTIIAKGNITLTSGVSELDGLYIAQPSSQAGTDGIFSTCDSTCNNQLVVNGAVIAQHVELLRSHGTLDPPGHGDVNNIGSNPAEIFNFVPSMVIGNPAFAGVWGDSAGLTNMAPVF